MHFPLAVWRLARWDTQRGPFAPLHAMNPTRCQFIRDAACSHFGKELSAAEPLAGLTAVDVGCGGGILCVSPRVTVLLWCHF